MEAGAPPAGISENSDWKGLQRGCVEMGCAINSMPLLEGAIGRGYWKGLRKRRTEPFSVPSILAAPFQFSLPSCPPSTCVKPSECAVTTYATGDICCDPLLPCRPSRRSVGETEQVRQDGGGVARGQTAQARAPVAKTARC